MRVNKTITAEKAAIKKEADMNKKCVLLIGFAVVLMAAMITSAGCDNGVTAPTTPTGPTATARYETVPYSKSGARSARAATDAWVIENQMIWSAYDDEKYYYVFLLGHVNRVPLAFRGAIEYNGTTPITIGYSSTNGSDESITNSVTTAN